MGEEVNQFPESTRKFRELVSKSTDIEKNIQIIEELTKMLEKGYSTDLHNQITTVNEGTRTLIATEQKKLNEIFNMVEALIEKRENAPKRFKIPSVDQLLQGFEAFTQTPLPVCKHSQVPPLCGALKLPHDHLVAPNSYACIKYGGNYILAFVLGFDPDTMCYVCCDAVPSESVPQLISIPYKELLPMPTTAPARRTKATTFQQKARVLALWPNEAGFTSELYPATVKAVPTITPGWYKLRFDGNPPEIADVPEKLIVKLPEKN